jgi:hypothetical protein
MKLIGLLSWYDEPATWLAAAIASHHKLSLDHLIAVDGAYALFPNGTPRSPGDQHVAIHATCEHHGIGLTIHTPTATWQGNEVEKRTHMFRLADTVSRASQDWYVVIDADHVLTDHPADLRDQLASTRRDVAQTTLYTGPEETVVRNIFRAIPGLRCKTNHYTYVTPSGRKLWGNESDGTRLEPALELDVRIEHRTDDRHPDRKHAKTSYYEARDTQLIERGPCALCDQTAERTITADWELTPDGNLLAGWLEVCNACYPKAKAASDLRVRQLGHDPTGLQMAGAA